MAWRRASSGLLLPGGRQRVDPASPLADRLGSLWVPALGLSGNGLVNLAPGEIGTADFPNADTTPGLDGTELGIGLKFDGSNDRAVRRNGIPWVPNNNRRVTLGMVVRMDTIAAAKKLLYAFVADNGSAQVELNVRTDRLRIQWIASSRNTGAEFPNPPTAGQVAFISAGFTDYNSAWISLYEPATGRYETATDSAGTLTTGDTTIPFQNEVLGAYHTPSWAQDFAAFTLLDAWFWDRQLSEDELWHWRTDRWSILAPARRPNAYVEIPPAFASASQSVPAFTQTATARRLAVLRQTATVLAPVNAAGVKVRVEAQQGAAIPAPGQGATASAVVGDFTFDDTTTTFDSTVVRMDGSGIPSSALEASQSLAPPVQQADASVPVRASSSQLIASPQQTALTIAINEGEVYGQADATIAPFTGEGAAAAVVSVSVNQVLRRPVQTTWGYAVRLAHAEAGEQQIPPFEQTAQTDTTSGPPPVVGPPLPDRPIDPPAPPGGKTGDLEDMIQRQAAVLPPWFGQPGTVPPILRLPLAMAGSVGVWLHQLIAYARRQTRIRTATEGWLDLIAYDFFGTRIRRRQGQGDESFRRRILVEMFRPRGTRPAMVSALRDLTGIEPRIFEPSRPQDTGGIGIPSGLGIGVAGAIGSIGMPGEVFIDVYRSPDAGIPYAAGIGVPVGGIGVPSRLVIGNLDEITGTLKDEDVFAAVEATRPVGVVAWVRITLGNRPST